MIHRNDFETYAEYRKAVVRESQRKRRAAAKEQGLCSICCLNIPEMGYKTCSTCRKRISDRHRITT